MLILFLIFSISLAFALMRLFNAAPNNTASFYYLIFLRIIIIFHVVTLHIYYICWYKVIRKCSHLIDFTS